MGLLPDPVVGDRTAPPADVAAGSAIGRDVQPPEITPLLIVALAFQQLTGIPVGARHHCTPACPRRARDPCRRRWLWLCGGGELRCSSPVAGEAGAARAACLGSGRRYPVTARPAFFCQAAIISRDRAPNTPSLPPVGNPAPSARPDTLAVGLQGRPPPPLPLL